MSNYIKGWILNHWKHNFFKWFAATLCTVKGFPEAVLVMCAKESGDIVQTVPPCLVLFTLFVSGGTILSYMLLCGSGGTIFIPSIHK